MVCSRVNSSMKDAPKPPGWYSFGPFCVNVGDRVVLRSGERQRLEPKPFDALCLLLEHPGEVVTYEQFRSRLWPGVTVETVPNVNTQINKLRRALGDSARSRNFIQTVRGEGYRLNPTLTVSIEPPGTIGAGCDSGTERLEATADNSGARKTTEAGIGSLIGESLPRRRWIALATGTLLGCVPAAYGCAYVWRRLHRPARACGVAGATLSVYGSRGVTLWQHTFEYQLNSDDYRHQSTRKLWLHCDVDDDGEVETLFIALPLSAGFRSRVVCFAANGDTKWEFCPTTVVRDRSGRSFGPPYVTYCLENVTFAGQTRVIVSSLHHSSYPSQLVALDGNGTVRGEFWHRGSLWRAVVADWVSPRVLVGGVNDAPEYKCATILSFAPDRLSGSSEDPLGIPYFSEKSGHSAEAVLYFPRTAVSRAEEFNRVSKLIPGRDRLAVVVAEGIDEGAPSVVYELDSRFRVLSVTLGSEFVRAYNALPAEQRPISLNDLSHDLLTRVHVHVSRMGASTAARTSRAIPRAGSGPAEMKR